MENSDIEQELKNLNYKTREILKENIELNKKVDEIKGMIKFFYITSIIGVILWLVVQIVVWVS
jgi:hypothetical protein